MIDGRDVQLGVNEEERFRAQFYLLLSRLLGAPPDDDVFEVIKKKNISESQFDLIFCDPPFKDTNIEKLIELIFNKKILSKNGIIILHRNKIIKEKLPNCTEVIEERTYGISKIIFGKFLS